MRHDRQQVWIYCDSDDPDAVKGVWVQRIPGKYDEGVRGIPVEPKEEEPEILPKPKVTVGRKR